MRSKGLDPPSMRSKALGPPSMRSKGLQLASREARQVLPVPADRTTDPLWLTTSWLMSSWHRNIKPCTFGRSLTI